MEGSTALVISLIFLTAGGATGAVMMAEDAGWMGNHDGGVDGVSRAEPLPYGSWDGSGSCSLGRDAGDCGSGGDCGTTVEDPTGGGCCC